MPTKVVNGLDLLSQRIQNVGAASLGTDAVTLDQVQAFLRGLDTKDPVRVATTGAITLSGTQTIDGVTLVVGDAVLVKNQGSALANGIYLVASGAWTRRTDADENSEVTAGLSVTVLEGTTKGSGTSQTSPLLYTLSNSGAITLGTTALNFVPVGGSAITYSAGNGLSLSGTTFSVTPKASGGIVVDGTGVSVDTGTVSRRYSAAIGDGAATSITVTHNLNTTEVGVALWEVSSGAQVIPDVTGRTVNTVVLAFASAPASGAYRVKVTS